MSSCRRKEETDLLVKRKAETSSIEWKIYVLQEKKTYRHAFPFCREVTSLIYIHVCMLAGPVNGTIAAPTACTYSHHPTPDRQADIQVPRPAKKPLLKHPDPISIREKSNLSCFI